MPRHSRAMPLHNAQESSDRAAFLSPPDLAPTGADGVFVPSNGVITLNLACLSHHPTVEARDTSARTSLRLLAVLNVLFKYACARQAARASS